MSDWEDDTATRQVTHGLANRVLDLGVIVVLGAILMAVGGQFIPRLLERAKAESDVTEAATGIGYIQTFWEWFPLVVVVVGLFMLIAGAAVEARRPGI